MAISALEIRTPATDLPISLGDAKSQLRVTHNFEDSHIQRMVAAATSWAQNETRRILMNTNVRVYIDRFPYRWEYVWWVDEFRNLSPQFKRERTMERNARDRAIFLPGGRVTAVNNVTYIDDADASIELAGPTSSVPGTEYQEDLTDEDEAFVFPAIESDWPSVRDGRVNSVFVDYQVGYGDDPDAVPDDIKQAIRYRLTDLHRREDGKATVAAENLLHVHRILEF